MASTPPLWGGRRSIRTTSAVCSEHIEQASSPGARLGDYGHVRLHTDDGGQPEPHHGVIIDDDDANHDGVTLWYVTF